jgi:hypothetical protein
VLKSFTSVLIGAAAIVATAAPAEAASQRVSGRVGQFARWRDSICVHVDGLAFDQAAKIAARVGDVAKAVGVGVQPPGCPNANIEVEFTSQPQSLLDNIAAKRPQLLGYHYSTETKALKTVTHPIQAWYMTATVGNGPNAGSTFGGINTQTGKSEVIDEPDNPPPTGCAESRISTCLSSVYKNILVVADTEHLQGKDLGVLSDYIALVALSRPASLDGCGAEASVLDVLAKTPCPGRDAPKGLTPTDAASITALYASDLKALKAAEQSEIDARMAAILTKAKGAAH